MSKQGIAMERRGGVDQSVCSRRGQKLAKGSELLDHVVFIFVFFF